MQLSWVEHHRTGWGVMLQGDCSQYIHVATVVKPVLSVILVILFLYFMDDSNTNNTIIVIKRFSKVQKRKKVMGVFSIVYYNNESIGWQLRVIITSIHITVRK